MLNLVNLENISFDELSQTEFDVGIFASGYETRSSYLARNINPHLCKNRIVFGFAEYSDDAVRHENDKFYENNYGSIFQISSQEERKLYDYLIEAFARLEKELEVKILIDYTSMARLWYSGILNFIRLQSKRKVTIYLNYSLGVYDKTYLDYSFSSISSIPFHEGTLSSNTKTMLVLAVGFSPYLIKAVIEEIEPNYAVGILPISIGEDYNTFSQEIKLDILVKDIDEWINCPINNLESIFCTYADITNNNFSSKDILFLSLGPKIFTMASLLVAQRFPQVTCLYLKSAGSTKTDIKPAGEFICNKITYNL